MNKSISAGVSLGEHTLQHEINRARSELQQAESRVASIKLRLSTLLAKQVQRERAKNMRNGRHGL